MYKTRNYHVRHATSVNGITDGVQGVHGGGALLPLQVGPELSDDTADGGHGEYGGGEEHLHLAMAETIRRGLSFDQDHMDPSS